jgi:hypothetical protein
MRRLNLVESNRLPGAFQDHLDARMALRERGYQLIGELSS